MSHLRVLVRELRAVLSTAVACALIFGLVFSNVAQAARGAVSPNAAGKAGAHAQCVVHFAHRAASEKRVAPPTKDERSDRRHCPDCCLSAHAAAVLPERCASVARPAADRAAQAFQLRLSARAPDNAPSSAVNGARAPPSRI
jgi:hypothetical protein